MPNGDLYPDSEYEVEGAAPSQEQPVQPDTSDDESENVESALLPKSLMIATSVKPGDTITLKVLHVYDGEVEVAPVSESKEDEESPAMTAEQTPEQEIDAMAT
jgi:antitoxin component of MazEF toxin-antitoxin module